MRGGLRIAREAKGRLGLGRVNFGQFGKPSGWRETEPRLSKYSFAPGVLLDFIFGGLNGDQAIAERIYLVQRHLDYIMSKRFPWGHMGASSCWVTGIFTFSKTWFIQVIFLTSARFLPPSKSVYGLFKMH